MHRKYSTILFDADDTLLDFQRAERTALEKVLCSFSLPATPQILDRYNVINASLWRSFERGEITKEDIKNERYHRLLEEFQMQTDVTPREINDRYLELLGTCGFVLPGAKALCSALKDRGYDLYIITNGVPHTQRSRMERSGLLPYFSEIFVSETIGVQKPFLLFFTHVLSCVPEKDPTKIIVVGDSLGSDMQGAVNAGLDCIWFNPRGKENDRALPVTIEVQTLLQVGEFFDVTIESGE